MLVQVMTFMKRTARLRGELQEARPIQGRAEFAGQRVVHLGITIGIGNDFQLPGCWIESHFQSFLG